MPALEVTFGRGVNAPSNMVNIMVAILTIHYFGYWLTMLWCNFLLCLFFLMPFVFFCVLFVFLDLPPFSPCPLLLDLLLFYFFSVLSPPFDAAASRVIESLSFDLKSCNLVAIVMIFSSSGVLAPHFPLAFCYIC